MSESVLGRRRSAGGRLFHTVRATTEQARLCMIVVRANGTESSPSPMSAESDYFENQIQIDKGRLGKSEPGPIDIATPWRQPCIVCVCVCVCVCVRACVAMKHSDGHTCSSIWRTDHFVLNHVCAQMTWLLI